MQKKSLLLIDSSQVLMDLTKKILEREGYTIRCAVGLAGAREHLMDYSPDAIVMEHTLPDGDGLDFCRELRRVFAGPILFLSTVKEDELLALRAGANDFLKKPYDQDIMIARIAVLLNAQYPIASAGRAAEQTVDAAALPAGAPGDPSGRAADRAQANIKGGSGLRFRRALVTVASCFALVLVGFGAGRVFFQSPAGIELEDNTIPLAMFPFETDPGAVACTQEHGGLLFPGMDDKLIPADTADVGLLLQNPEGNPGYFVFEVTLAESGESLYTSGLIAPGKCLERILLSRGLPQGEYRARLAIRAYSPESLTPMNGVEVDFLLTAE